MVAIICIGFALRIAQLGKPSLWLDEAITWLIVSAPLREGVDRVIMDVVQPPLHYLLLRPFAALGLSEFALRFPSVIFGVASIPLMYRLAREMAGTPGRERRVGLLAALLLAANPFHVWFAREARNYELVFLLSVAILYMFHRVVRDQRGWLWFTVASALAYLTHYFALFLALVQLIYYLLSFHANHGSLGRWLAAQILAGIPLMLWVVAVVSEETARGALGWIPQVSPYAILFTLWNFAILYVENNLWWEVVGLPFFASVLVLGLRARPQRMLLILWLFLPCLIILLLSRAMGYGFYVDRYFILSLPAFVLLLARGLGQVRYKPLLYLLAVCLLVVSTAATVRIYSAPELAKQDWREAMSIVASNWQPGDLKVVETPAGAIPAAYYLSGHEGRKADPPYPEGSFWLAVLGRSEVEPWTYLSPRAEEDPWPAILDLYTPQRVWLIVTNPSYSNHRVSSGLTFDLFQRPLPIAAGWLTTHRDQILKQYMLPGITVVLIDTASGSRLILGNAHSVRTGD
jgi:mannosyltransferase